MLRALSIGALLLACHGPSDGVTFCGAGLHEAQAGEARTLQRAEYLSLTAIEDLAKRKDGPPMFGADVCRLLDGLRLYVRDDIGTSTTCECESPPRLCGSTHIRPDGDWMELRRDHLECLAHELMHYGQYKLDGEADPRHEKWTARGFYAAETLAESLILAEAM